MGTFQLPPGKVWEPLRKAIADLFSGTESPIELIKWKEIYDILEQTIDKAEDVANIIERITIKHA